MDDFLASLRRTFLDESHQILECMEAELLHLEKGTDIDACVASLFRYAHNLKGSSHTVDFTDIGTLTHAMEDVLNEMRSKRMHSSPDVVNELLASCDLLNQALSRLRQDPNERFDVIENARRLRTLIEKNGSSVSTPDPSAIPVAPPHLGESSASRDLSPTEAFGFFDEPAPALAQAPAPAPLPKNPVSSGSKNASEFLKIEAHRIESLNDLVGELVIMHSVLQEQTDEDDTLATAVKQLGSLCREIQARCMGLRMIPFSGLATKLQRVVRDTAQTISKNVELHVEGGDILIDKSIFDALGDPLVHLLRNAVDHGLETPEQRLVTAKPTIGKVTLSVQYQGAYLVVEVKDDGKGIDPNAVRKSAIKKSLIKESTNLSEEDILMLIFQPGFSTRTEVSEISGRGVGLDVVRTNVEGIGGHVKIKTHLGHGTTFQITLPLTLAVIDGLVIKVDNNRMVIPLNHVQEVVNTSTHPVVQKKSLGMIMDLRGDVLRTWRLADILGLGKTNSPPDQQVAVVARSQELVYAMLVDEIVGRQQVVIKKLGNELSQRNEYSGTAIMGDGQPSLIIDLQVLGKKLMGPRREGVVA